MTCAKVEDFDPAIVPPRDAKTPARGGYAVQPLVNAFPSRSSTGTAICCAQQRRHDACRGPDKAVRIDTRDRGIMRYGQRRVEARAPLGVSGDKH